MAKVKISELPVLGSGSLNTILVGDDNGVTYQIPLSVITASVVQLLSASTDTRLDFLEEFQSDFYVISASIDTKIAAATNEQSLAHLVTTSSFNSFTQSYTTDSASFNSRIISGSAVAGTISSSAQITALGFITSSIDITSLNTFTQSIDNRVDGLEAATASYLTSLDGAISGAGQISDLGFVTGAYTTINEFNSLTQSFNSISQSFTTISGSFGDIDFSGINAVTESYLLFTQSYYSASASFDNRIDGLETFSSSADNRYVLSGSITQTTWDNIANKPNDIVSSSTQITNYGFISESVDITSLNLFTQSAEQRIGDLEAATASYLTSLDGVISSSTQVDYTELQNIPTGIISGSSQLEGAIFDSLTIKNLHTLYESSSVVYSSGSNQFGDALTDLHIFSGSVNIVGSGSLNGNRILTSIDLNALNTISASYLDFTQSYYTDSSSVDSRLGALETLNHSYTGSMSGSFTGSLYVDYILFNSSSTPTLQDYMLRANTTDKTLDLRMGNNATLQLGQEIYYPPIVNKSGDDLSDGTLVMINPAGVAQGNRISVVKAVGDGTYPADFIVGVLTEDVANNQEGFATWFGYVRDINKTNLVPAGETWSEGQILYPHPTIAGKMTNVLPTAPALKSTIAAITAINGNNVTLLVRPALRGKLDTLHNVNISGSSDGDILMKSGSVWVNNSTFSSSVDNRLDTIEVRYATTGSNTFIGTETISGSLLLSGSFSYNGTPLQNGFTFAQPRLSKILNNVSYTGATAWDASYTGSGGAVIVTGNASGFRSSQGTGTFHLYRDGVSVASHSFYFNQTNTHTTLPTLTYVSNNETGSHTYQLYFSNILVDTQDYGTITVLEYGNSAIVQPIYTGSFATTSSLNTFTSSYTTDSASFDSRITSLVGAGASVTISDTAPSTPIQGDLWWKSNDGNLYVYYGGYWIISNDTIAALPTGVISGSSQLPTGLISGSSQIDSLGYLNTTTYQTDSASFSTRILNSQPIGYLTTASYQTDSASFSSRINAGGTISSSGQITLSATTEYSTFSASLATTDSASAATTTFLSTSVASRLATQEFKSTIFATTGSNSFTGSQNITGSLTVSSVATISSSIAANASSLTLSNGSNLYIQNNGVAEISGSLNVSGSTTFTGSISISSGSITMPNRPAFRVYGAGGGTAATTVLSGSMTIVDYNQGGWDNTTGTFTAPIAGLYQVNIVARCIGNANPSAQVIVYKNNTTTSPSPNGTAQIMVEWAANTTANHVGGSTITKLAVGDTLKAVVALGTISFDGNDNFSVAYIG